MDTQLIKITSENFAQSIELAAGIIKGGGVVAMPTETVYGLAASAFDEDAVKEIFVAKGRPQDNPLIVHICDYVMLKDVVSDIPPEAAALVRAFWPGPLTVVLPRRDAVAPAVSCGLPTVAVRMPNHPVALELIKKCSVPLAAPSANLSGRPSTTTAAHVVADMNGRIPLILDGGACEVGIESTVVSFAGAYPKILRPGVITLDQIKQFAPNAVLSPFVLAPVTGDDSVESPGLKHTHYSPKASVVMVKGSLRRFSDYVKERKAPGVFAMCFNGEQDRIDIPSVEYGDSDDYAAQARRLFATLRALDKLDAKCVYARAPKQNNESLAVLNRLIRAAGFEVVEL